MKKIVVISKWVAGMNTFGVVGLGFDGGLNPFKKRNSSLLISKLKEEFQKENLDIEVVLDNETDIEKIIYNKASLILISPFIESAILPTLTEKEKEKCYFLKESEFINLEIDNIVNIAKNLVE